MWISAADVAHIYRRTVGAVYALAHRHSWKRRKVRGRVEYDADQVDNTMWRVDATRRRNTDGP